MYEVLISAKLEKILKKIRKKDKIRYEASMHKIKEISSSSSLDRYKNLRYSMKDFKRVHIDSNFVLIFKAEGNSVKFYNLQHHDHIYQ